MEGDRREGVSVHSGAVMSHYFIHSHSVIDGPHSTDEKTSSGR